MRTKLLIFAGFYLPARGGYIESLHGLCKRLVIRKISVTILTAQLDKASPTEETIDGVRIVRLPVWNLLRGTYPVLLPTFRTFQALNRLHKEKYSVVSTQTRFFTTSFWGAFFAKWRRRPLIHVERGAYHSIVPSRFVDLISRAIDHTLGTLVVKAATVNVGVSAASEQFLKHLGARKTTTIVNGVELIPKPSPWIKQKLRKKWKFTEKDKILLFVGRLIYAKGVQDILPTIKELQKKEPHLTLVVVGDGPYRVELETMAASYKSSEVRFLGMKESDEVKELLQIADWFVNPSHSEGLPRSVLEGAAAGLPMVATDVGGTSEIIENGVSGWLVRPESPQLLGKALEHMITHPEEARIRGAHAQQTIKERFEWSKVTQLYVDLIKQVL